MANNKINQEIVDGLTDALDSCVHKTGDEVIDGTKIFNDDITAPNQKTLTYENARAINCNGATTVILQDTDEIIQLAIANNSTITFDTSQLSYPKSWSTFQLQYYFPSGVKTVSHANPLIYINGNVPDFSDGKLHWAVIRQGKGTSGGYFLMSDAGTEG